jgi:hypothetical protein
MTGKAMRVVLNLIQGGFKLRNRPKKREMFSDGT